MTWADILAEIQRGLKEPSINGHWTPAELLRRTNIGQRKIVRFTGCLQTIDTSVTSVAGTAPYNKPTNCLRLIRIIYANKRIYSIPIEDLDIKAGSGEIGSPWQDNSGTPTNYYETFTQFVLYPKPEATGDIIGREYLIKPTDLVNTIDVPFNAVDYLEDYHDLLVSYVLYQCLLEDQLEFYVEHKNIFEKGMVSLRNEMRNKPDELLTFSLVKRRKGLGHGAIPFLD